MDIVQGKWIVNRRSCAATLINRGESYITLHRKQLIFTFRIAKNANIVTPMVNSSGVECDTVDVNYIIL